MMRSAYLKARGSLRTDRRILLTIIAGLLVGFLPLIFPRVEPSAATVRPGFEDRLAVSVDQPIGLDFTPDGRMLVISKSGKLRVYNGGQLLQTPALNISSRICADLAVCDDIDPTPSMH